MARFSNPFSQFFSDSGRILPGAQLFFYVNGTTTPQATYEDAAFTVVNPNPVICGTNGRVPDIFMPDNLVYSITLTDTNGVQIDQADDITGSDSQVSSEDVIAALTANTDPVVINGSSATINANTTVNGNQTITGTLGVTGALTASGGVDGVLGGVTPAAVSATTGNFSGRITASNNIESSNNTGLRWEDTGGTDRAYVFLSSIDQFTLGNATHLTRLRGSSLTVEPDTTFDGNATVNNQLITTNGADLTISSGVITVTGSNHRVDTQGGAATDDLDTINGGSEGAVLYLFAVSGARNVVVKNGTGNIASSAGDITLSGGQTGCIVLVFRGGAWRVIGRA